MKGSTRAAMAVGIGYLLGRRRNFKTAAVMAAGLAVGSTTAGGLLMKRAGKLAGSTDVLGKVSPQLGDIAGIVQKDLLTAGKAAATAVVSSRVDSLADSIHERAERVRNPASAVTGDDEDEDEDEPANAEADADYEDRDRDQDQDQDQDEEPAASVRRTGATRRSPVTRTSGAAGSATKSASKKAGGGTSTAARSAGGAAKSAASGARSRSGRAKG